MAKKLEHLNDSSQPSFEQIAKTLEGMLYRNNREPDEPGHGSVLTLSYEAFYGIVERDQLRKRLYTEVELEASRIGLVVAFGWNAVIVATDDNFVPEGWSTFVHQPRPPNAIDRAPPRPRPKPTEAQKRALFSRIGRNRKASS